MPIDLRTPYDVLYDRVEDAIHARQRVQDTFTPQGKRIDDLVDPEVIEDCDPVDVVRVAADLGFEYDRCDYGLAHPQGPRVRANGKWVDVPEDVATQLRVLHGKQEDSVICPECVNPLLERSHREAEHGRRYPELVTISAYGSLCKPHVH